MALIWFMKASQQVFLTLFFFSSKNSTINFDWSNYLFKRILKYALDVPIVHVKCNIYLCLWNFKALIWQPLSLGGNAQYQQQTQPQAQVDSTQSQQSQALASSPSFANYVYDPSSGYYYNSTTGLYYDANTQVLLWNKYWILLKITWLLIDWHQLCHSPNLLWP